MGTKSVLKRGNTCKGEESSSEKKLVHGNSCSRQNKIKILKFPRKWTIRKSLVTLIAFSAQWKGQLLCTLILRKNWYSCCRLHSTSCVIPFIYDSPSNIWRQLLHPLGLFFFKLNIPFLMLLSPLPSRSFHSEYTLVSVSPQMKYTIVSLVHYCRID